MFLCVVVFRVLVLVVHCLFGMCLLSPDFLSLLVSRSSLWPWFCRIYSEVYTVWLWLYMPPYSSAPISSVGHRELEVGKGGRISGVWHLESKGERERERETSPQTPLTTHRSFIFCSGTARTFRLKIQQIASVSNSYQSKFTDTKIHYITNWVTTSFQCRVVCLLPPLSSFFLFLPFSTPCTSSVYNKIQGETIYLATHLLTGV